MEVTEMAETSTRAWTRWQDWALVVFGLVGALSTIWVDTTTTAMWTLIILGALIALDGLWSLAMPGMVASEGVEVVLGVLLFIAPWVLGYTTLTTASWFSWVVGALAIIVGGATLPVANSAHTRLTGQH
jgi:SPW repeat